MRAKWIQFGFLLGIGLQSPALGMEREEEASASATAAAEAAAPMPSSQKPCAPGVFDRVLGNSDLSCHILSFLSPQICRVDSPFQNPHFRSLSRSHYLRDILNMGQCNRTWHTLAWKLSVWEDIIFSANPNTQTLLSFGPDTDTRALREESLGAVKHLQLRAGNEQHLEIMSLFHGLQTFIAHIAPDPRVLEAALCRLPEELKHLNLGGHTTLSQCDLKVLSRFQDLKSLDVSGTHLRGQFLAYLPSTLEHLDIVGTQPTLEDAKKMGKFQKLATLNFSDENPEVTEILLTQVQNRLNDCDIEIIEMSKREPKRIYLRRGPAD